MPGSAPPSRSSTSATTASAICIDIPSAAAPPARFWASNPLSAAVGPGVGLVASLAIGGNGR